MHPFYNVCHSPWLFAISVTNAACRACRTGFAQHHQKNSETALETCAKLPYNSATLRDKAFDNR